jgi:NADH:ubiquinone oxidoreductase subunit E
MSEPGHEIRPTDDLTAAERHQLIASMRPEDAERVPELHEVEVPDDLREEIEAAMGRYPEVRSASIPALWAIQRRYGWCSPEGIRQAAAVMGLTPADLQAVASFYDLFHLRPSAPHRVLVCTNISCWLRGGDELLEGFCEAAGCDPHEASHGGSVSADGEVLISGFECLGACDMAPMASIDGRYFGPLEIDDAETVIGQLQAGADPVPDKAMAKRTLAGGSGDEPFTLEIGGEGA